MLNGGLETESDILEIRDTKVVGKKVGRESIYIAFFKEDRKMYITQSPLTVDVKEIATDFDVVTTNDVSEIFIDINSEEPYEFFRVDTIPEDSYAEVIIESSNPEIIVTEYDKYNYPGIYKIESKSTQKEDATITVKVNHLPSKTKTIEVHAAKLPNYISLNENLLITGKTAEKQITATVYPEDSDYSEITWSSSDDDVATVIDGKITVKKNGFASITATTQSGLKASTTVLALNTSDDFTLAQDSALKIIEQGDYAGYITDNNEFIGYKYTTTGHAGATQLPNNCGKWDIIGKDKDGIWKSSTYVDAGWGYKINEEIQSLNEYGFTTTSDKKLTLLVRPVLVYNKGIPYVLFVHALTNNSNETLTEQKIGVGTDIQIAGNDQAPVNVHESGAFLLDEQTNMIFSMNCLSGESVTPVDSMWIGNYSSGAMKNVYTDLKQNVSGIDSALSYSWQNIELAPGETKVFSTRLTFVVDQGGTLDAIVY